MIVSILTNYDMIVSAWHGKEKINDFPRRFTLFSCYCGKYCREWAYSMANGHQTIFPKLVVVLGSQVKCLKNIASCFPHESNSVLILLVSQDYFDTHLPRLRPR